MNLLILVVLIYLAIRLLALAILILRRFHRLQKPIQEILTRHAANEVLSTAILKSDKTISKIQAA